MYQVDCRLAKDVELLLISAELTYELSASSCKAVEVHASSVMHQVRLSPCKQATELQPGSELLQPDGSPLAHLPGTSLNVYKLSELHLATSLQVCSADIGTNSDFHSPYFVNSRSTGHVTKISLKQMLSVPCARDSACELLYTISRKAECP